MKNSDQPPFQPITNSLNYPSPEDRKAYRNKVIIKSLRSIFLGWILIVLGTYISMRWNNSGNGSPNQHPSPAGSKTLALGDWLALIALYLLVSGFYHLITVRVKIRKHFENKLLPQQQLQTVTPEDIENINPLTAEKIKFYSFVIIGLLIVLFIISLLYSVFFSPKL